MPSMVEYGIGVYLGHSHKLPIELGARSLHTKGRNDNSRICKMVTSSFQHKYVDSRILGETTGYGQARSPPSYDDEVIGCF